MGIIPSNMQSKAKKMKDRLIFENGWQVQRERVQDQVKKMDRLTQEGKIKTKKICLKKEIR